MASVCLPICFSLYNQTIFWNLNLTMSSSFSPECLPWILGVSSHDWAPQNLPVSVPSFILNLALSLIVLATMDLFLQLQLIKFSVVSLRSPNKLLYDWITSTNSSPLSLHRWPVEFILNFQIWDLKSFQTGSIHLFPTRIEVHIHLEWISPFIRFRTCDYLSHIHLFWWGPFLQILLQGFSNMVDAQ